MTDDRPLDDRLPQQPEPAPETDIEAFRRMKLEEQGIIERGGTQYDMEQDYLSRSVLMAQVRELNEHISAVNAKHEILQQEFEALLSLQQKTVGTAEQAFVVIEQLQHERDALQTTIDTLTQEIETIRATARTISQRPLATAALLVASTIFSVKEKERE